MAAAKSNPFRVQQLDKLQYRLEGASWDQLLARLKKVHYRAAIIGPHGHGKSTLLESFQPHLETEGWLVHRIQLGTGNRRFDSTQRALFTRLGKNDCLFLDGAEQLHALAWRTFLWQSRKAGALVITAHRAGLLPTIWECNTSVALLNELVQELDPQNKDGNITELFQKHHGNLRDALRELYDSHSL